MGGGGGHDQESHWDSQQPRPEVAVPSSYQPVASLGFREFCRVPACFRSE